jgi:hypothetical protein
MPARTTSMHPSITASLALHGRVFELVGLAYGSISSALRRCLTTARSSKRLTRTANKARKMAAKAIRKMQVPAYCPVDMGIQDIE